MSTEFYCPQLDEGGDEARFVQYARRSPKTGEAPSWEFGDERNFDEVLVMLEMGFTFAAWAGQDNWAPKDREGWIKMLADGRVTFGHFPIVVEYLSPTHFRFNGEGS